MKRRTREARAVLNHLNNVDMHRRTVRDILDRGRSLGGGLDDLKMFSFISKKYDLPVLYGEGAIKSSFKGYLTALHDKLGRTERDDLLTPRATRGIHWLQGYWQAQNKIKEIVKWGF